MSVTRHYTVTGMSCGHCENAVKDEISALPGVENIVVSAQSGELSVTFSEDLAPKDEAVAEKVEEAGYSVVQPS